MIPPAPSGPESGQGHTLSFRAGNYEEHLTLGDSPAEARARALEAAGDWSALQERIEGEEVEMRARRVIGLAAAAALATIEGRPVPTAAVAPVSFRIYWPTTPR